VTSLPKHILDEFMVSFLNQTQHINKNNSDPITTEVDPELKSKKHLNEHLIEVLSQGILNNMEHVSLIQNDEYRKQNIETYKRLIIKPYENNYGTEKTTGESNRKICKLHENGIGPVCPHYFEIRRRDDMYPNMRMNAICSCPKCLLTLGTQSNNQTSSNQISYCGQVFTYFPVLVKKDNKWEFFMEEVPTSCACMFNLKSY